MTAYVYVRAHRVFGLPLWARVALGLSLAAGPVLLVFGRGRFGLEAGEAYAAAVVGTALTLATIFGAAMLLSLDFLEFGRRGLLRLFGRKGAPEDGAKEADDARRRRPPARGALGRPTRRTPQMPEANRPMGNVQNPRARTHPSTGSPLAVAAPSRLAAPSSPRPP
ncbi:MAG: hypothetical protein AAF411_11910 [Myxococcota bacterium]